ncbi:hypothetical protein [Mycoplasmoides pirum]|uniref:hypothetical protein n=1 Tax=Mycoplasmoides pirum TaxID=2122 RepID=UPI0004832685|nr:hypothetical protein [Mycoplasmoides pirum]
MSEYKIALKNTYISFIVNIISLVVSFLTAYITNQFLGTSNYGFLNIATAMIPYVTLILGTINTITVYRLYEPLSKKNYVLANELMQRSLYEYRTRGSIAFISLLILALVYPFAINIGNTTDGWISTCIILAAGFSSFFSFLFSPIYQQVLSVERKGYLLQIFDLIGKIFFNAIFIGIVVANHTYNFIGENKWLLILSAFSANLVGSFGIIVAFVLRKKFVPWFVPKMSKKNLGDNSIRRQIIADAFISQFITNTSFFIFGIYGFFSSPEIAATLAGIFANYFVIKNSISSIMSIIAGTPSMSYARIFHTENKEYVKFAYKTYDYFCFILAMIAMLYVMFCSPYLISFIVNDTTTNANSFLPQVQPIGWPTPNDLLNNSFNLWIGLLVSISCFIELSRSAPENNKSITGEYKWKFKFALVEAIINVSLSIINTIIAFYFPKLLNGLYLIFGLILSNVLAVGFRYIILKISVIKYFYEDKRERRKEILNFIFLELILVLVIGIVFSGVTSAIFINKQIHLSLNGESILILFLIFLISSSVVLIITTILIILNSSFKNVTTLKLKEFYAFIKLKLRKKSKIQT